MPWCNVRALLCSYDDQQCSKFTLLAYPFFLLILILSFYIKYMWIPLVFFCILFLCVSCGDWGSRTARRNLPQRHANNSTENGSSIPVAVPIDQGGDQVGIDEIPSFPFERKIGSSGDLVCSVCLEVLHQGEMVRRLPACQHLFHLECIDMWLGSHSTCPLCRSSVEVAKTTKANEADQSPV
ncbi:hypothetical protein LUZ60_012522 [Juncus effusus]|nr:hypothetical protein LUZ60_012522 [Juncus effusus]